MCVKRKTIGSDFDNLEHFVILLFGPVRNVEAEAMQDEAVAACRDGSRRHGLNSGVGNRAQVRNLCLATPYEPRR